LRLIQALPVQPGGPWRILRCEYMTSSHTFDTTAYPVCNRITDRSHSAHTARFTTSVIYLHTNERATLSNGSLANSRIINSSRSPQAYLYILLKFHIDAPYEKLEIFHTAIEKYFRSRPREWLSLIRFCATRVEADLGYVEYIVAAQHREGWTSWNALRLSQARLATFSLELSKKLDIRFKQPPLPVDLSIMQPGNAVDPASILNPVGGVPGGGGLNQFPGNQEAPMGFSPDLASLQARFAPVPST
jgi:hypothetical protein